MTSPEAPSTAPLVAGSSSSTGTGLNIIGTSKSRLPSSLRGSSSRKQNPPLATREPGEADRPALSIPDPSTTPSLSPVPSIPERNTAVRPTPIAITPSDPSLRFGGPARARQTSAESSTSINSFRKRIGQGTAKEVTDVGSPSTRNPSDSTSSNPKLNPKHPKLSVYISKPARDAPRNSEERARHSSETLTGEQGREEDRTGNGRKGKEKEISVEGDDQDPMEVEEEGQIVESEVERNGGDPAVPEGPSSWVRFRRRGISQPGTSSNSRNSDSSTPHSSSNPLPCSKPSSWELEALEERMNARLDRMMEARDEEIKHLKEQEAESRRMIEESQSKLTESEAKAKELENQILELSKTRKEEEQPRLVSLIDERIKLTRKTLLESLAARVEADTTKQIAQATETFGLKVTAIDTGFQDWWAVKELDLNSWLMARLDLVNTRLESLETATPGVAPKSRLSTQPPSVLQNSRPSPATDPRRPSPSNPSILSRPIPSEPAALRSSAASSSSQSSRPHFPIESNTTTNPRPSSISNSSDFVTQEQWKAGRRAFEAKFYGKLEALHEKLYRKINNLSLRFDKFTSNSEGSASRHASPSESPKKNAADSDRNGGDERPTKRLRLDESPAPSEISDLSETQITKDLKAKIEELSKIVGSVSEQLRSAQEEIASIAKDKEETLKRMADGDKSVGRKAETETKKVKERLDRHGEELSELKKNLETRISEFEKKTTSAMESAEADTERERRKWEMRSEENETALTAVMEELGEVQQRDEQSTLAKSLKNVAEMLEKKLDREEFAQKLATKVDADEFRIELEGKVDDKTHQQDIDDLRKTVSMIQVCQVPSRSLGPPDVDSHLLALIQPIQPEEVKSLIDDAFNEKDWDNFTDTVAGLRSTNGELKQAVEKLDSKREQESAAFKVTLEGFRTTGLETARAIETLSDVVTKLNAGSRLDALEASSQRIDASSRLDALEGSSKTFSSSLEEYKARLDEPSAAASIPSTGGLGHELKELRQRLDAHQSSLETRRSEPTPPTSPPLPTPTQPSGNTLSRSVEPSKLDPAQMQEVVSKIVPIMQQLLREFQTHVQRQLNELFNKLDKRINSAEAKAVTAEKDTRNLKEKAVLAETEAKHFKDLLDSVKRLGETLQDSLRDYKTISNRNIDEAASRLNAIERWGVNLDPAVSFIYTSLQALAREAAPPPSGPHQPPPQHHPPIYPNHQLVPPNSSAPQFAQNAASVQMQAQSQQPSNYRPSSAGHDQHGRQMFLPRSSQGPSNHPTFAPHASSSGP
ncbi:uncharacterized protein JCM6883_004000 [Sporobolomyces salmoneus]|uniref:uncharacterized protein n=1 Tax=Sporobolomyces salmoneus TaxID=183962 RepID=UPI003172B8B1